MTEANLAYTQNEPTVNFEYRFGRESAEHDTALSNRTNLILQFVEKRSFYNPVTKISIYPVARAGKSGSQVFYLDLLIKGVSYPKKFIAKFQDTEQTDNEYQSAKMAEFSSICGEVTRIKHKDEDLGLLVFDLAKISDHIEFRGFFLDTTNSDEDCSKALTSAYDFIGNHPNKDQERKSFLDDYDWYVVRKSQPLLRVESFKNSLNYSGVTSLATKIGTHYKKIADLVREHTVFPYLVHGDLHARNLMLSAKDSSKTELIDFGWVHFGHPAKDFSLMEVTLKYMLLHELLQKQGTKNGPSQHLPLIAFEQFEIYLCEHVFDLPHVDIFIEYMKLSCPLLDNHLSALRRVYLSLQAVRSAAKLQLNSYCSRHNEKPALTAKEHYFVSNFLIAYGLNGFEEVEPIWILIGLDIVGKAICAK